MGIVHQIDQDLKESMLARNEQKVSLLRMLKTALKNAEIEKRSELDEAEAGKVLEKQAKQRRDSIESYQAGNRKDLAEKEAEELRVIEGYLPEKMSSEEIEKTVTEVIGTLGVTDISGMGQVIKEVMTKTAGQADGKTVSEMVRQKLA